MPVVLHSEIHFPEHTGPHRNIKRAAGWPSPLQTNCFSALLFCFVLATPLRDFEQQRPVSVKHIAIGAGGLGFDSQADQIGHNAAKGSPQQ